MMHNRISHPLQRTATKLAFTLEDPELEGVETGEVRAMLPWVSEEAVPQVGKELSV